LTLPVRRYTPEELSAAESAGSSARSHVQPQASSMPLPTAARVEKKGFRLDKVLHIDDEVHFIRSWIEKPLATGAVMPSGRLLARAMARYVDPTAPGPVIELGPGTGPVTEALVRQGVDPSRLILVEFNPTFCRLLRSRYPEATVVQGDAYRLRGLLETLVKEPAAALVSSLPLMTKTLRTRVRLISDAIHLMAPSAPFVQFTYAMVTPIPKATSSITVHASELVLANLPPARVWVYRGR
jgi:phosphatidylethanolamine/phosphatidyl-N-methylethanolamine N-methyltransferase